MDTAMRRLGGFQIPNGLLHLICFISNAYIAGVLIFGATKGWEFTTRKFTIDRFGPGLMNRYQSIAPIDSLVSNIQDLWNHCVILKYMLGQFVAIPFIAALGSHELWLRRINDTAQMRGKSLSTAYIPQLHRFRFGWSSLGQWFVVIVLALATLAASLLVTFGAWVVEDNNPNAGLSLRLSRLNETIYYGDVIPMDAVSRPQAVSSEFWSDLLNKGFVHVANPTMSYNALYPEDKLNIPSEMRNTAYYLPRSSFPALESHLLTSARTKMEFPVESTNRANLTNSHDIRLGDTVYSSIQTMGIGVNISSYERFMGDGLPGLPRDYEFAGMMGEAYGTEVKVRCVDITYRYRCLSFEDQEGDTPAMNYLFAIKEEWLRNSGQESFNNFAAPSSSATGPLIFSHLTLSGEEPIQLRSGPGLTPTKIPNNIPMQTLFIIPYQKPFPDSTVPDTQVLQCLYWPTEFAIEYMVQRHPGSPLLVKRNHYLREPRSVNPIYALPAARAIHELLATTSTGGVLREVLKEYYETHPQIPKSDQWTKRNANMIHHILVEPALSATAEAYFSLLRQRVEIANVWLPLYGDDTDEGGEQLALENLENETLTNGVVFLILRVGGSAPYKLHFVGILVMALIGANRLLAAWRGLVFGRGERRFGKWWERDLVGEEDVAEKEVKVEKDETRPLLRVVKRE